MKKTISLVLALCLMLSVMPASANYLGEVISNIPRNEAPQVYYNGEKVIFPDAYPQNMNSRIMVPFRAVLETMGASVEYDDATAVVTATRNGISVSFRNGSTDLTVVENGVTQTRVMDVAPVLEAATNRTFVPVRFLAEELGMGVNWDGKNAIVCDYSDLLQQFVQENALLSALNEKNLKTTDLGLSYQEERTVENQYLTGEDNPSSVSGKSSVALSGTLTRRGAGVRIQGKQNILHNGTGAYFSDAVNYEEGEFRDVPFEAISTPEKRYVKQGIFSKYVDAKILYEAGRELDSHYYVGDKWNAVEASELMDMILLETLQTGCAPSVSAQRAAEGLNRTAVNKDTYRSLKDGLSMVNRFFSKDLVTVNGSQIIYRMTTEAYLKIVNAAMTEEERLNMAAYLPGITSEENIVIVASGGVLTDFDRSGRFGVQMDGTSTMETTHISGSQNGAGEDFTIPSDALTEAELAEALALVKMN